MREIRKNTRSSLGKKYFAEVKNVTDSEGATPLHRALEKRNISLAKVLLSDIEVKRNIKDRNGQTAIDLLTKLCKREDEWTTLGFDPSISRIVV
ncbi:Acyl-CoA-binding domain-containing protein 2 [Bienertia sinuspersici]